MWKKLEEKQLTTIMKLPKYKASSTEYKRGYLKKNPLQKNEIR